VIYTKIKELAAKSGITIGQLEVATGIPRTAMQEWNNHMPAANKLLVIAKYFGVTVEDLLEEVS
jgi:transcriptional regulator with XRE-family HTH domain